MKVARNILLIAELILLVVAVVFEVYFLVEVTIGVKESYGLIILAWAAMLIFFGIASIVMLALGIISTVFTRKINNAFCSVNIEDATDSKYYSFAPGILGIILPVLTFVIYFVYPFIFLQ